MTESAAGMRILILGAGAIGGYLGARLQEAGADVTLLVREHRLAALHEHGLQIRSPLGDVSVQPRCISQATPNEAFDIVVLTCKAYDLETAVDAIAPAVGPDTRILPLLNGLAHLSILDQQFTRQRVMAGFAHMAAESRATGQIEHLNDFHQIVFGVRDDAQRPQAEKLQANLQRTSLSVTYSETILQALWNKFIFLTTLAGACCLFRASSGEILATPAGPAFLRDLLAECVAVATASGQPPEADTMAEYRRLLNDPDQHYSASMLRHVRAGLPTENEHILGDMYRRAIDLDCANPCLALAYSHLLIYERQRVSRA